jgi:hypothetical protein
MQPANEEDIIIKGKNLITKGHFEVTKFDELEGILEVIVYRANKLDTQKDFMGNATLEKACEWNLNFLISKGKNEPSDINHNFEIAKGVYLMQTGIDKSEANWIWRQKINIKGNETLMQKAKDKTITGVSLAGRAKSEEQEKGMIKSIYEMLKSIFDNKEIKKEAEMTVEQIKEMTDEQLSELGLQRKTETPPETPELEKATEAPAEEPKEPEELTKAKADLEEKEILLSKAQEQIDTLKTEVAALKKDNDILEKRNLTNPNTDGQVLSFDELFKQKMETLMKKYGEKNGN